MKSRRQRILDTASDLAGQLMYYDRKEDEQLGVGEIEKAIIAKEITVEEILDEMTGPIDAAVTRAIVTGE